MQPKCPVIGIVGGIGAGKSEVARAFEKLGCIVTDSDALARDILNRPEIAAELAAWWGPSIRAGDGRVDRRAVARLVFSDPAQRRRLENMVHPLIRAARQETIRRARSAGAPGVVVDAPLLFEAGVDKECDAVVFVEAPYASRLARVENARGWNKSELEARESVQMSLDEKRRRADHVMNNAGDLSDLQQQAAAVLAKVRQGQ